MTRAAAAGLLLMLGACHGSHAGGVTLDADEDARNATGAKIDADLAAADAAARKPLLPTVRPAPAAEREEPSPDRTEDPSPAEETTDNS